MHVTDDDLGYAEKELKRPGLFLFFGGREWEDHISRYQEELWFILVDYIADESVEEGKPYPTVGIEMRRILNLPFAAIFSANHKSLPLILASHVDEVRNRILRGEKLDVELRLGEMEVDSRLNSINPKLANQFKSSLLTTKISEQKKLLIILCVLVLLDRQFPGENSEKETTYHIGLQDTFRDTTGGVSETQAEPRFELTEFDKVFLRSVKISID